MTEKSLKWRLPLMAAILAACLYYAIPPFAVDGKPGKIKLGLDLQGGMHLVLEVDTSKLPPEAKEDATVRAVEIIRNRIDQFGVAEPSIQREGTNRIVVQLPGVTDRERALQLLGKTALMEFKLVSESDDLYKQAISGKVPDGYKLYKMKAGEGAADLLLEDKTLMTGEHLTKANVGFGEYNQPDVEFELDGTGAKIFAEITRANIHRRLAIVLDGVVQSAPEIQSEIPGGKGVITGRFTLDQATDLSIVLRAGALPAPIVVKEERSVGPSLGKDSIDQGINASCIGFALVFVFMLVYYLFAGFVANLALAFNILIILAALSYFHATLTLPGIAGAVLTMGMAVDTNVLIFERIREEQALKKPMGAALAAGYKKAFTTILDSNVTTLITAAILYYMGSGPVKGFALTLAVGLIASMFTGITVTRAFFDVCLYKGGLKNLRMFHFLKRTPKVNFLKYRKVCYVVSIALIGAGLYSMVQRGEKLFGVEFTGGTLQEYRFKKAIEVEDIRKALSEIGYGTATIQHAGKTNDIIIRSVQGSEEAIQSRLEKDLGKESFELLRLESIGPVVGKELKIKALWALLLSLLGIWAYVVYRFDFRFAAGAILALIHDGLVTLGLVSLTGREYSVTVFAAVLTILGFSINDTIVIFDRIRERRRLGVKESFEQNINTSVNQTLSRTILTSMTVLFVVIALYLFGGEVINDFAFTMLAGVIAGTYSTVYIAAPVLVDWPGQKK